MRVGVVPSDSAFPVALWPCAALQLISYNYTCKMHVIRSNSLYQPGDGLSFDFHVYVYTFVLINQTGFILLII